MRFRLVLLQTFLALIGLNLVPLAAQETVAVRVLAEPSGARFTVDGMQYSQPTSFLWPVGSKHVVSVVAPSNSTSPEGEGCASPDTTSIIQYDPFCKTRYLFTAWETSAGALAAAGAPSQTITADPSLTFVTARFTAQFRVDVRFFDRGTQRPSEQCAQKAVTPGPKPAEQGSGVVFVGGACMDGSGYTWAVGPVTLNAVPFDGFIFKGWTFDGSADPAQTSKYDIKGPTLINPRFEPAKRVRFYTNPLGLRVRIDSTEVLTIDPDNFVLTYPIPGYFDWVGGSRHVIGGMSPQVDLFNRTWVFRDWSNGSGQDSIISVDNITNVPLTLTANYVRGVHVSFLTEPLGLKLQVEGRNNWPSTNFVWGVGMKYTVTAPAEQTDAKGRKYVFKGWSNEGPATQEIVPGESQINSGIRLIATFEPVPQAIIRSSIPGMKISVDGQDCLAPCRLDRPAGTELQLSVPPMIAISEVSRHEFTGWSDGVASPARVLAINTDAQSVTANYRIANRLFAMADPGEGASFSMQPASDDAFYPADTQVAISVNPKPGFRFRRWDGDLSGTIRSGSISMSMSRVVRALLDRVPYVAPAGVKNAAADLPEPGVAAGSLIAIYGANLTKEYTAGPVNPLAQTLGGTVVLVGDRLLGLVYVSPEQINAQLPSDLEPGSYKLIVRTEGSADVTGDFDVVRNAPGLFVNQIDNVSYVAALHEDGSPITPASPATRTELVSIIGTGFGPYTRRVIDGFATPATPSAPVADPIEVLMDGARITPTFAGAAPHLTGMAVAKFRVGQTSSGRVELRVSVNGRESNTAILPVE